MCKPEYDLQELRRIANEVYVELVQKAKRKDLTPYEVETLESAARLAS